MKSLKHSLLVALLVTGLNFGCTSATAADQQGNYKVEAKIPCSIYLKDQQKEGWSKLVDEFFIRGYVSAFNMLNPNTLSILGNSDIEGAMLWIKNYCEKQPLDDISKALRALTIELYPNRIQKAS
jgi:hypothetical protein